MQESALSSSPLRSAGAASLPWKYPRSQAARQSAWHGFRGVAIASLAACTSSLVVSVAQAADQDALTRLLSSNGCEGCNLGNAGLVFANLEAANLGNADLSRANFSRAILSSANLRGANLSGAVLYGANLHNADLRDADLRGADLRGAFLGGAQLEGAQLQGAILQGAIALPADLIDAETYQSWGLKEAQAQRHEAAIAYYNQAIQRQPQLATAYLGRSFSISVLGDLDQAVRDAEVAQSLFQNEGNSAGVQTAEEVLKAIASARAATAELEANPRAAASPQARGGYRGGGLGASLRGSLGTLFRSAGAMVFKLLF